MFLGISKHHHDNHRHYDKSAYELFGHGCNSIRSAHQAAGDCVIREDGPHQLGRSMRRKAGDGRCLAGDRIIHDAVCGISGLEWTADQRATVGRRPVPCGTLAASLKAASKCRAGKG
jgi:hypothetical protein